MYTSSKLEVVGPSGDDNHGFKSNTNQGRKFFNADRFELGTVLKIKLSFKLRYKWMLTSI